MKNDAQFGAEIRGHHSLTRLIVLYFGAARGIFVSTRPKSGATQYRMKVVFAIDSFKGSMSSLEAADAAEKGLLKVFETAQAVKIPVADGGEGTVEALAAQEGARLVEIEAADPLGRRIRAHYAVLADGTAVMEMARASGITLLSASELNPMKTSTFGTGEIIAHALKSGARKFAVGIGGSATNDGGMGMLAALGFEFFNSDGERLSEYGGENLAKVASIKLSGAMPELAEADFTVLCDVSNPFSGPNGAAHVYAPQKGATPEMVELLDAGLKSYAKAVEANTGMSIDEHPGAGAAGGLGGAFLAFLKAKLKNGIEGVLDASGFDEKIEGADFIVTGEGRLDIQSSMGKAPEGVARRAHKKGIPVIALGGGITEDAARLYDCHVGAMFSICPSPMALEDAVNHDNAMRNMERASENIFRLIKTLKK